MTEIEIINNENNLPGLNLEEITKEIIPYFPLLEKVTIKNNNTILLKGEVKDFECFMDELYEDLPKNYSFENELKGENYNLCEIIISKKNTLIYKVESCLVDWEKLINELNHDEKTLSKLKEDYETQSREIIQKTDFNKLYNANNDKVRKAHVKKELKELSDKKENLEFKISDSKRRISLLKAKTYAEIELMKITKHEF